MVAFYQRPRFIEPVNLTAALDNTAQVCHLPVISLYLPLSQHVHPASPLSALPSLALDGHGHPSPSALSVISRSNLCSNPAQPTRETWHDHILERIAEQSAQSERKTKSIERRVDDLHESIEHIHLLLEQIAAASGVTPAATPAPRVGSPPAPSGAFALRPAGANPPAAPSRHLVTPATLSSLRSPSSPARPPAGKAVVRLSKGNSRMEVMSDEEIKSPPRDVLVASEVALVGDPTPTPSASPAAAEHVEIRRLAQAL